MDIKAFIFDMDGLLFDSERIVQRSWEIAGDELGIPHMGDVIYHTLGMNRAGRNKYFRKYIREDFLRSFYLFHQEQLHARLSYIHIRDLRHLPQQLLRRSYALQIVLLPHR